MRAVTAIGLNSIPLLGFSLVTLGCQHSTPERWIIPAGYNGWVRLDYAIKGYTPLPLDNGVYVVRVPESGRVFTSSVNNPVLDKNQYFVQGSGNLSRLYFGWPPKADYAVQSAYAREHLVPAANLLEKTRVVTDFECLFVGSRVEFTFNGRDCSGWGLSDPIPPMFPKQRRRRSRIRGSTEHDSGSKPVSGAGSLYPRLLLAPLEPKTKNA
jgi:hypothetical protein